MHFTTRSIVRITSPVFFLLLLPCAIPVAARPVPLTDIQVFRPPVPAGQLNNRGDEQMAIDNDIFTLGHLTPPGTTGVQMVGLDLGGTRSINRFRVDKFDPNNDGSGGADSMDLRFLYTTDTGPLNERTYVPVTGLTNGYLGNELLDVPVNPIDATADNSQIGFAFYSVTFDPVAASGFALQVARDPDDSQPWVHYGTYEFQLLNGETDHDVVDIEIFTGGSPGGELNNRPPSQGGEPALAIDGDLSTIGHMTPSGTTGPNRVAVEFASLTDDVERIRVAKIGNTDGLDGSIDNMDLTILYTTDAGPLHEREYRPVTGLANGHDGSELIVAAAVNPDDATVDSDHHDFTTDGWYSLSFDAVTATALAIEVSRDPDDPRPFVHYGSYEIEVYAAGAALAADFDKDGDVDGDDFLIWQANFATTVNATPNSGDTDGDGDVDGDDFLVWQQEFGTSSGNGSGVVPEPATTTALGIGGLAGIAFRRRRQSGRES